MSQNFLTTLFSPRVTEEASSNEDLVKCLVDMGYTQQQASQAFKRCSTIEAALEWILNQQEREARNRSSPSSDPSADELADSPRPSPRTVTQLWMSAKHLMERVVGPSANAPLPEASVKRLCDTAQAIFAEEDNLLNAASPATVVGDIHGQFHDLLHMFTVMGFAPDVNYIFLGDYVDRGSNSVETIQLLLALKIKFPSRVTLLRGNHECRDVSRVFGFYDEVYSKYGSMRVWSYCTTLFDHMPLACLIDGSILCVHGGLSPDVHTLDDIRLLDRFQEVPFDGPMVDLVWSDPSEYKGWDESSRGVGYLFGPDISEKFNHTNGLQLICRAHQLVPGGYKWMHDKRVVTIFSAPNYCNSKNKSAVMTVDEHLECDFHQFSMRTVPNEELGMERQLLDDLLAASGVMETATSGSTHTLAVPE